MHPMVRNLYKRVLHVGRDYPAGMEYVRSTWKRAIRNPLNCPSCYDAHSTNSVELNNQNQACREELLFAVNRGRRMVKEMEGVVQLKKYRAMRERYDGFGTVDSEVQQAMHRIERQTPGSSI
jgi:hypothetical protein